MRRLFILAPLSLLALSLPALAERSAGEELFHSTTLGTNGKSCHSCHADGNGLKELNDYDSTVLQGLINICIEDALKGKPLADDATELRDIEIYIRQFSKK